MISAGQFRLSRFPPPCGCFRTFSRCCSGLVRCISDTINIVRMHVYVMLEVPRTTDHVFVLSKLESCNSGSLIRYYSQYVREVAPFVNRLYKGHFRCIRYALTICYTELSRYASAAAWIAQGVFFCGIRYVLIIIYHIFHQLSCKTFKVKLPSAATYQTWHMM